MKIRRVEAELFHTDGQTDMTELIVAFRNFANAPKYQPVNAVQRNNRCLFLEPLNIHKYAVCLDVKVLNTKPAGTTYSKHGALKCEVKCLV